MLPIFIIFITNSSSSSILDIKFLHGRYCGRHIIYLKCSCMEKKKEFFRKPTHDTMEYFTSLNAEIIAKLAHFKEFQ